MKTLQRGAPCIGRILLSLIFLASAAYQINSWEATSDQMEDEGILRPEVLLPAAVVLEIGGGLLLLLGVRARYAAFALMVFLVPATVIYHDFWQYTGPEQQAQLIQFLKNTAILGGLIVVLATGAGGCSFDAKRERRKASTQPGEEIRNPKSEIRRNSKN